MIDLRRLVSSLPISRNALVGLRTDFIQAYVVLHDRSVVGDRARFGHGIDIHPPAFNP